MESREGWLPIPRRAPKMLGGGGPCHPRGEAVSTDPCDHAGTMLIAVAAFIGVGERDDHPPRRRVALVGVRRDQARIPSKPLPPTRPVAMQAPTTRSNTQRDVAVANEACRFRLQCCWEWVKIGIVSTKVRAFRWAFHFPKFPSAMKTHLTTAVPSHHRGTTRSLAYSPCCSPSSASSY